MFLRLDTLTTSFISSLSICGVLAGNCAGMDEPRHQEIDIAIIGGGMAGLTTAYNLNKNGISCSLFEAKPHLGGRTHTHYFKEDKSQYYEEGGTIIDSDHESVIRLANDLKVNLDKVCYGEGTVSAFQNGNQLSDADLIAIFEDSNTVFEHMKDVLDKDYTQYYTESNNFKSILTVIDQLNLDHAKEFWKNFIKDECGVEPKDAPITMLDWLYDECEEYGLLLKFRGNIVGKAIANQYFSYRVTGGMSNLVEAVIKDCSKTTFNPNFALKSIEKRDSGYHLVFKDQQIVVAQKVVMAIPFSTLRDVKIHDNIGLNSNCVNAINYLSYGTNAKIGLPVDGKFEMLYHMNLGPDHQFTSWPGHNAVTIMLGGEAGKNLTIEGTNSLIEAEVDNLRHAYPAIGAFGVPCFKNWAQDPYAKGSYSASSTALYFNSDPSTVYPLICQYANPINENTFVFAGEHTIYGESNAHIEGAVKSGELAAEIIYPSKKQEKENCSIQ